ncbi:MAG: DUF58 domain-containing protein [Pirellulales bacterium]|nr:DUF58 domain-containing protein [Pirellulales bacterium]
MDNAVFISLVAIGAVGIALGLQARIARIYPGKLLTGLFFVPIALTTLYLVWPGFLGVALAIDFCLLVLALVDLFTMPSRAKISVTREMGGTASLKKKHPVTLRVSNSFRSGVALEIKDGVDLQLHADPAEFEIFLPAHSRRSLEYNLNPTQRGSFTLTRVFVRVSSLLRLWRRYVDVPQESTLHVYPDMKQLAEYEVLARSNRLSLMGVRRTRRIGQDNEFERLRDYTQDDNFRAIDWRATSRRRKLTVKDYQSSQSQTLMFLVDCGRMMTNEAGGISLLDHALNSMLMLSYIALARGDSVGMIAFSESIHGFVPPKGGTKQMNRLLHASFDRFPKLVESRYDQAFLYLNRQCRKRSLVIFISNLIDEVNANQVRQYMTNMVGKHLPLGVLLRDRRLFDAVDVSAPRGEALFRAAAAANILTWRHHVLADMSRAGVLSVDVFPEEMTAPLVNQYLEIKARHLL